MDLPSIPDRSLLLTYGIGDNESIYEALTRAFRQIQIDVYERDTTVHDWTEDFPIEEVDWDAKAPCRLSTVIWDHPTVITSDTVRIYEEP